MGKFHLGQLVATRGALRALELAGDSPAVLLQRHMEGDWGDLSTEDKKANDYALENDLRILSAYILSSGVKVWIITEFDRSHTTLLLPSEY